MAFTPEELEQLGAVIDAKVQSAVGGAVAEATTPKPQTNDEAQNQPENQPDYYVHLANGHVVTSKDSAGTHMTDPDSGETVMVIGRYPVGA
jgi:hypothetical protein